MTITTRKLGIAVLTLFCLFGSHGVAIHGQPADEGSTSTATPPERERPPREENNDNRHRGRDRDRGRDHDRGHYNPEAFRQFIRAELEHVPGLRIRMRRLMEIQGERQELQKQRQAVAANPDRNRAATIERFHSLLRRDFSLSDESRKIAQEIVTDLPGIKKQLYTRRENLHRELDQISAASDPTTSSPQAHDLRRKIRYVEYLDKKLRDLEDHPERLDVLTRMMRGVPFDEGSSIEARTPQAHLADLRKRKRELQQELRQVENEINLIKAKGVMTTEKSDSND